VQRGRRGERAEARARGARVPPPTLAALLRRSERRRRDYLSRYGVECAEQTSASIKEHFERCTLAEGLPSVRMPALFVHGENDPLPPRCSTETAANIQDATVELVPGCGHFPWLERPGAVADAFSRFLAHG
jgi:pimeloyl-ACP methyl ester carboxylesterase